jgi:ornithine cyclodeaminase
VATRALARHDARVLAIIGAGAQAYHQVEAVCTVRPIERVIIVNRSRERAERLAALLRERAIAPHIDIAASSAEALPQADVICCATSSPTPVFDDASLRPGVHINGIGSFTPQMVEVPPETVGRAYVVVDQQTAAWAEAGDLQHARGLGLLDESQTVELGAVIAGIVPARTSDDQITFFKSVGNAVQDIAVAQLALREAERLNLGIDIDL